MKKLITLIFSTIIITFGFITTVSAVENVAVYVNGTLLETDQPAIIVSSRTMVPLRAICEALACEVLWDNNTRTATIQNDFVKVGVQINNYKMKKVQRYNGTPLGRNGYVEIDVPPIIYNNRTMVPVRAISEALGATVEWDNQKRCVNIDMEFYEFVSNLNDRTIVKQWDKYGVISSECQVIIPVIYDSVKHFDGLDFKVEKDDKVGIFGRNGEIIIPINYNAITKGNNSDYLTVMQNGKWGLIDYNCNISIPIEYDKWHYFGSSGNRYHKPEKNGKVGVADLRTGKMVIPCIYDKIEKVSESIFRAKLKGEWVEIDLSNVDQCQ